jgi:hypothetical protein
MIILAGAGYYFLTQKFQDQKNDLQSQITTLQNQIKTAQEALTSETDTSDWKTYTNETYGFSMKYPSDWTKKTNTGEGLVQIYSNYSDDQGKDLAPNQTKTVVYAEPSSAITDLQNYVTTNNGKINSVSDITVGNLSGKKYIVTPEVGTKATVVYVLKGNTYFEIICMENSDQFDTILSTFQFTQ